MADSPIKLRGHHLLCLLTYKGYGYTRAFIDNFDLIAARITSGTPVELVRGPDQICASMLNDNNNIRNHCSSALIADRDILTLKDIGAAIEMPMDIGQNIILAENMVTQMRQHFSDGSIRGACANCHWQDVCSEIAKRDFRHVKVHTPIINTSGTCGTAGPLNAPTNPEGAMHDLKRGVKPAPSHNG